LLFVFSGLIKANDPLGLSYKMLEFFEAWGIHFLDDYTLAFSLFMNVCEVLAGVAIIIGWQIEFFSWFLLVLIIFFTFLTAYVLFSGKIKECGCFGDCIPLSGMNTFAKDVALLLLILVVFFNPQKTSSLFSARIAATVLFVTFAATISVQFYVLEYLPFLDCLPYKKGNNILNEMKVPAGAVSDSFAITFKYKKNNRVVEFDQNHFPADFDSTYEYVDRFDKLIRKGNATPAIADFSLRTIDGNDSTNFILHQNKKYILLFVREFGNTKEWKKGFETVIVSANKKSIPVYLITAEAGKATELFKNVPVFKCDATVIKTAARANPTYFIMKQALILNKLGFADIKLVNDFIDKQK
ncbi:MAG TPA: BT_3928 family protein, partial [Chitinophagaceae bacterium]|nr:BT_3928 family protein [Chitinophagaceae bacterium]